ncbi:hypothetical protein D3C78_993890 [compost metagenome]
MPGNPTGPFRVGCLLVDCPFLKPLSGGIGKKQVAQRPIPMAKTKVKHAGCSSRSAGRVGWKAWGLPRLPAQTGRHRLPTCQRVRVAERTGASSQYTSTQQQVERTQDGRLTCAFRADDTDGDGFDLAADEVKVRLSHRQAAPREQHLVGVRRGGYLAFADTLPLGTHIEPDVAQRAGGIVVSETVWLGAPVHVRLTSSLPAWLGCRW